jgi:hypothetical protein
MKKILFAIIAVSAAMQTQADDQRCYADDIDGDFVLYQNSVAPANPHIGTCHINISSGALTGICTFTEPGSGTVKPGFSGDVTGMATINTNCSAQMEIDFTPAPGVTVQSSFDVQLSQDKQSLIGEWTNNFGLLGTSAGLRYDAKLADTPAVKRRMRNSH